ncbi:MAG: hypothetical protein KDE55_20520 [Novosphingobium sp.]|nr:hypothetical protein [Novosphingobium sp.]
MAGGVRSKARGAAAKAKTTIQETHGPSPNPKTNLVLADIALRGGSMLLRRGVERGILGIKYNPEKARKIMKGRTVGESLAGAMIARLATRSIPGAILVGGGILAKTLYDRKKGQQAKAEGEEQIEQLVDNAEEG